MKKKNYDITLLLIIVVLLIYYLIIAYNLLLDRSPDELLRYKIPLYIYKHGSLPVGTNKEVMLPFGNYSYAYYPQLLGGTLSAIFMKIMALFSTKSTLLVFAARWTSAIFGVITVWFTAQSCKLLTNRRMLSNAVAVIVGVLPQFAYLSAYVNNDVIAIGGVSVLIYSLIMATKRNWSYKSAVIFAGGVIICLLGYLNSIPIVFVGICYAIFTIVEQCRANDVTGKLAIKIIGLSIVTILLFTLPLYIRNYYLYHDFIGAKVFNDAYQRWLANGGNQTMAPYNSGTMKMVLDSNWIVTTFKSAVSLFGYMNVSTKSGYYIFYLLFFYTGVLFKIVLTNYSKTRKQKIIFDALMLLGVILTLYLSMYRSATTDFQPQGRYILTIFPIIVIWWIEGINKLSMILDNNIKFKVNVSVILYMVVSLWCILRYVILNPLLVG
ncbi:hypothetical protein [Limosilactobacillus reuteri]|uniref:hypothetical protein n=1 Tax=Limosilactobacillus reuteri TaxID=1598 RepID=UPI00128D0E50|nr:hypothetical protein [Limosilactobacillus reuteri]MQB65387.1 hypothetical protein [Limosilactobacillus reuteri]